ncbi:transketolase [Roseomonas nepalensis]|uniref:Pyruvate dehydrogenase E1 component n=1 Tax=Muricoccus nepalensis TaxID=1854500 RepID=A0A502GJ55_9PROT|nr:transketolase [Roseomonas nepalensis]TPG61340.1 transketolase [Roseomonas nepalensis]
MHDTPTAPRPDLDLLGELERKVLWLATWMIHNANHLRETGDGLKVGGHQASSASMATILTALYLAVLRPEDRVAVKPHASPVFHAIQYLLGRQTREKLENFRGFGGAQSYPSRTKDTDGVDFSTGSVGLGVAQTLFSSLTQDYLRARGWGGDGPEGRMVALLGDAEMDEGNIFEALMEGWKHGLRNTWWVVDYNRQSLDAVVREGLWSRLEATFRNFGWDVVVLRHGTLQRAAFAEPGGERLRDWIEACPNPLYSALTFQGGAAWRRRLLDDLGDQGEVSALIGRRSDEELAALMGNLAGHDLPMLLDAFEAARGHDRPTCFIAYTIKGSGLPLAGHKDNHAGLMNPEQMERFRRGMRVREGHEWDRFEGLDAPPARLERFLADVPFARREALPAAPAVPVPAALAVPIAASMSTQAGFGLLMHEIAKGETALAARIVTASPDVTVSTNLGAWVNRRGLFAKEEMADLFRKERIPSTFNWTFSPSGQHMELGIAEMNLFTMLSALGLAHDTFGERLLPVGTLYDPFIERALDAMNYACYQGARFIVVATPSGTTLAPEGGAHQSIRTPLIGLAQDGLDSFEPAYVDELAVILRHALARMQEPEGASAYLRLSTRVVEQPRRAMTPALAADILAGGYWMREPGPNPSVVIAYAGTLAPEAIEAVGLMAEDRRDVGLLAVTSADRLHAGWTAAQRAREGGEAAESHAERLLAPLPPHCRLVTVLDGHPATLSWLGSVHGHRARALGVERFGQTGTIAELRRHYGIDAQGIAAAAQAVAPGRPIRHLRVAW